MSTTDITLTTQEKKELEKRGFLVKKNFNILSLYKNIINMIWVSGILLLIFVIVFLFVKFISVLLGQNITSIVYIILGIIIVPATIIFPIINLISSFILTGVSFYAGNKIIQYGKFKNIRGSFLGKWFFYPTLLANNFIDSGRNPTGGIIAMIIGFFTSSILISIFIGKYLWIGSSITSGNDTVAIAINILRVVFGDLVLLILLIIILILIRQLFQSFHPLYAFGNLGEKIQKLTPKIAEKSKEIEKNFASDMNYRVLSDGFDGLASTFSQIVSLVIRLEKVEARANKGNLFDSEKYIGSLRLDIVGPLRSLRSFLETQRTELTASHEELSGVRVQVGGTSEQSDLVSARTEPLMRELTENIDALDVMIEKMG